MDVLITIVKTAVLVASVLLLVYSGVTLYRWRRSVFSSTDAYLRNLRYIRAGEKVCIQAPDEPGIQYVTSGKSSKTMVYWEYWYTVEGIEFCKSYFEENDAEELPSKIKIYYNRKDPKLMYQEGAARDGVIYSVESIILGFLLLFALFVTYIW